MIQRLVLWAPTSMRALPTMALISSPPRMRRFCGVPGGGRTRVRAGLFACVHGPAHGDRKRSSDEHQTHQRVSPAVATALVITQLMEMRQGLGGFGPCRVAIVANQCAGGDTVVLQHHADTGHPEVFPGHLG